MQLVKEENVTELIGNVSISSLVDYANFLINFYQTFFVKIDEWLPKQERRFFIATIIIANKGYKYTDPRAKLLYKEIFNLRRQSDVRGYLRALEEKKYLTSSTKTKKIQLAEFFVFDLNSQSFKLDININFKNGEVE